MENNKKAPEPKLFTVDQANAALPLVRAIVEDIVRLSAELSEREERFRRIKPAGSLIALEQYQEELEQALNQFEQDRKRMADYLEELAALGVELKDHQTGLVDFRSLRNGEVVYLCWRLGEPEVGHWHELDAGFAGRRKLEKATAGR